MSTAILILIFFVPCEFCSLSLRKSRLVLLIKGHRTQLQYQGIQPTFIFPKGIIFVGYGDEWVALP